MLESTFTSDYHALQLSAERRGSHFSAKAYYTFGKALEDVDYQGGGLPAVQNSNRIELERARTSADRTHNFTLSAIWRADYFKGSKSFAKALLSDWTLSTIVTLQSGKVRLGIGSTRDPLLIEGTVHALAATEISNEVGDAFAAKTGFDPRQLMSSYRYFRIHAQRLQAWREANRSARPHKDPLYQVMAHASW